MAMADQNDPGTIRLQLSLLSAQDSAAAQQLAKSIGEIAKMFEALKASDFRESAQKMGQLYEQIRKDSEAMQTRQGKSMAASLADFHRQGGVNLPSNADLQAASDLRAQAEANRAKAAEEARQQAGRERDRQEQLRIESLTDTQHRADQMRRGRGLPGINTPEDNPDAWYSKVDALSGNEGGLRIPQFGQLTMQDYIKILRDRRTKTALKAHEEGNVELANRHGNQAAFLQQASNLAGYGYAFKNLLGFASSQGFNASQMDSSGAALGFRRDSNPFADILGIQTPFSAAGREGFGQALDTTSLRFSAGINKEQAARIVGASAQAGFSGNTRHQVATQFMGPLFRQFGIDPESLIPFTQVLRTGTGTIGELNKELANLGEGARAARMDVNSFTQQVAQSGEAAQQSGGSFLQGQRFGQNFSSAFGLSPEVGNRMMANPYVQAQLGASTGLPGFAQGALPASAKNAAIAQSLQTMVGAFRGSMPAVSTNVTDANGRVIGKETTSSEDVAIGAAAGRLGITYDEAKAMMDRKGAAGVSNFQSASRLYERQVNSQVRGGAAESWARAHSDKDVEDLRFNSKTNKVEMRIGNSWTVNEDRTKQMHDEVFSGARKATTGTLGKLHTLAKSAGVSDEDWKDQVVGEKDVAKRMANARKLVQEKAVEANADTHIAFTGPAAKFFKALVNKNGGWNQFGSDSSGVTSSVGPNPITSTQGAAAGLDTYTGG